MTPLTLEQALRDAGLTVRTYTGWRTRGGLWTHGQPVGIMQHHTAPPVPFPVSRLAGIDDGRIKCNMNTKPDGTVWLVAYHACNYSSGPGSSEVLSEVRAGIPPSQNARDRGLADNTNGNPFFWNFENDHPGDGTKLPDAQYEAIILSSRVVLDHFSLSVGNTISHAEWTRRKSDPYWNGSYRAIEELRDGIRHLHLEEPMTPTQARLELAAGVHARKGVWMEGAGEDPQHRLTRLAKAIADGERTLDEVLFHFGDPQPGQPNEPVPAWVLDPMIPYSAELPPGSGSAETIDLRLTGKVLGQ